MLGAQLVFFEHVEEANERLMQIRSLFPAGEQGYRKAQVRKSNKKRKYRSDSGQDSREWGEQTTARLRKGQCC